MKVAIYARYSSDNQRDASIADQVRLCRAFATRQGWTVIQEYADHAVSGATLLRSGFQSLMRDALRHDFDVVLAESLDRFSRDQEDTAGLFKRLTFAGVSIVTVSEGDITHLHIGLKGTMNALFLKDLADKTRRGLRGRIEAGRSGGGLCYGYRVVRSIQGTGITTGEREIEPAQSAIVERIFREFVSGVSPKAIAKRLNQEGVAGPFGAKWSPSTIHGHRTRGTGILNNELYIGRLVWNRARYVKDPDTGRRVSRLNPQSEWVIKDIPQLRVIPDDLWTAAKDRQRVAQQVLSTATNMVSVRRPKYLFSGVTKCGICGAGFIMHSHNRLACFGARSQGICTNTLTIRRDEVESRVLFALREKLMRPDIFKEFCEEFTREMNRLRMEYRAGLATAEAELARLETRRRKLVESIMEGVPAAVVKDELNGILARREELAAQLEKADEPPPLLHPNMANLYRAKVTQLAEALERQETRTEAAQMLHGLVDQITLTPDGDKLKIDLKGNLAEMLDAATGAKSSENGDLVLQVSLVAGGGFEPPTFGL